MSRGGVGCESRRAELGSGTVLTGGIIAGLVVLVAGATMLLAAGLSGARARLAADLSAVAGATALQQGSADPCDAAVRVARANGGAVTSCSPGADRSVTVTTEAPVALVGGLLGPARAVSRAGPESLRFASRQSEERRSAPTEP